MQKDGQQQEAYINGKVGVGEHLEIKRLVALVPHAEHSLQTVLAQGNAVLEAEVVGPGLPHVVAEICRSQAKVEADCIVSTLGQGAGL